MSGSETCVWSRKKSGKRFLCREVRRDPSERTRGKIAMMLKSTIPLIEDTLDANIPGGSQALAAAIQEYRTHISFYRKI